MPKYKIYWDAGYGRSEDIIEADSEDEALMDAYEAWREEAESQADYGAEEWDGEEDED